MALPKLDPESMLALARVLTIQDKTTGERVPWEVNGEQERMCHASQGHNRTIHGKVRQMGASTYFDFEDALWTWSCDQMGESVVTGIVLDTEAKSAAQLDRCEDFLRQMGAPHTRYRASSQGPERIRFPNGSQILAYGASGSRVGSSLSFHRFHFSEVPYWPRATEIFGSLMPALSHDGTCVIETTMDIKEPLARNLWIDDNEWETHFYSVEDHEAFRRAPGEISDERWAWAQEEGFTDRSAASWWVWAIANLCGGDYTHACRLYPQRPEHMFMSAEGRFIRCTTKVSTALDRIVVEGTNEPWIMEVFVEPEDTSGQVTVGVDTAAGKERDSSAVVCIDKRDNRIVASFVSDTIWTDDLGLVAQAMQKHYTRKRPRPVGIRAQSDLVPLVVIEENGVGNGTWTRVQRLGVPAKAVTTRDDTRLDGLLRVKRACEAGELYGPKRLADECDSLHRDDLGRFKGKKDLAMAIGFALRHIHESPYRPDPEPVDRNKFNPHRTMKRERKRNRTVSL